MKTRFAMDIGSIQDIPKVEHIPIEPPPQLVTSNQSKDILRIHPCERPYKLNAHGTIDVGPYCCLRQKEAAIRLNVPFVKLRKIWKETTNRSWPYKNVCKYWVDKDCIITKIVRFNTLIMN